MNVSAYIPAFNNAATLPAALASVRAQTVPVAEILVIDDGSTDDTAAVGEAGGARVIRLGENRGRGHARAGAMENVVHELVLALDGTNRVAPDFIEHALPFFADPAVAGVVAFWDDPQPRRLADRWRARHLFKTDRRPSRPYKKLLATHACLLRRHAVLEAGNFDRRLRHSEDTDLGERLRARGQLIWYSPACLVTPSISNPLGRVLERYWRWHAGADERLTLRGYLGWILYSWTHMARLDVRAHDWSAAAVSLAVPHLMAGRTLWRRLTGRSLV